MSIILRVAARAITQEQLTTWMVKLRKKAYSSLSVKQVIAVMEHLGGWRIEEVIGLEATRVYQDKPMVIADRDDAVVQRQWENAKEVEVNSLPSNPLRGKRYTMDVSDISQIYPVAKGFELREWWGKRALRFTSPEGKTFDFLEGKLGDVYKEPTYDLLPWVYKETNFVEEISRKLALPTPDEEKAQKAPRTRENTGSCPCCFGNFKLKARSNHLPGMVLHGFKRPGWGNGTIGRCIGVDFPPFELSSEGTQHLLNVLEKRVDHLKDEVQGFKSGKTRQFSVDTRKGLKTFQRDSETPEEWERLVGKQVESLEGEIKFASHDIRRLKKLIAEWKEKPLPEAGMSMKVWE